MKRFSVLMVGLMMVVAQSASAAAKETKMTAGVTGGVGMSLSPVSVSWRAGANFSYFVMPKLSVGLLALVNTTSTAGIASTFTLTPVAQGKYFLIDGLSVGLDVGTAVSFSSVTILSVTTSTSSAAFVFGPNVAYDFPIMDMLSVGAEVDRLFATNAFGNPALQMLANVKYRF